MLVLTRKPGQRIHVGPDIVIEILEPTSGKVRVGIVAPRDVPIVRDDAKGDGRKAA